jgi:TatD DNase family protein
VSPFPFVDTHCHLDSILARLGLAAFDELRERHLPPEFDGCITIACEAASIGPTLSLLEHPEVYGSFGIHPHDAKDYGPEVAARLDEALRHPKCVAYGEIGLDYHYDHSPRPLQREVFARQIEAGVAAGKPLILHSREAEEDTLAPPAS